MSFFYFRAFWLVVTRTWEGDEDRPEDGEEELLKKKKRHLCAVLCTFLMAGCGYARSNERYAVRHFIETTAACRIQAKTRLYGCHFQAFYNSSFDLMHCCGQTCQ
ncbi:hypothetical protein EN829_034290 [Mesorhizobium sp. M00.F.Ca.ET.186.01.1.1]|nr:hypothetical protein EN829_034290 [Mesorhizobium sp. M00.F.Ca.ET.186.01.1.1]